VIHSGIYYDQETRPTKANLCTEGNPLLYEFCRDYRVPALKTGKLMVATTPDEDNTLEAYLQRAKENGVEGVGKIPGREVPRKEPNVKAHSALWVPSAGIVEPTALVYRLHTLAERQGVVFMMETEAVDLYPDGDSIEVLIRYRDGAMDRVRADMVINAAGVDADIIARALNPDSPFELDPVRGESYKFYGHRRREISLSGCNVYPTPQWVTTPYGRHFTVGVHLTPTFEDVSDPPSLGTTVLIGPRLVSVSNRRRWMEALSPPGVFLDRVKGFFPHLREDDLIWHQAGLQARLKDYPDFIIERDTRHRGMVHLLGIDSPGLTGALSIARHVTKMM